MAWRKEAVAFFKKGKLDPKKALFDTATRLKHLENPSGYDEGLNQNTGFGYVPEPAAVAIGKTPQKKRKRGEASEASEDDPWQWDANFKAYKNGRHPVLGGQKYDITKMSRAQRAAAAYDKKDPLADVPVKDLKDNLLDFV